MVKGNRRVRKTRRRRRNPGLPDPKTVVSERTFVSPKGKHYRILTTTEKDPYDPDEGSGSKGKKDGNKQPT